MTKKTLLLQVVLLVLVIIGSANAQFVPLGIDTHRNVAEMGMGGIVTTVSTNTHAILYNPGLISRQDFAVEITLPAGVHHEFSDIVDLVQKYSNYGENGINVFNDFGVLGTEAQGEFMKDSQSIDNKWIGLKSSPFIGLVYKNFGMAIYQTINANVKLDQGVLVPALGMRAYSDIVVAYGFGKNVDIKNREVGLGFAIRTYQRQALPTKRINALNITEIEKLSETIIEELPDPVSGLSFDLGAIHRIDLGSEVNRNSIDFAIVIQDIYGVIDGVSLQPNLKFGTMYYLPFKIKGLLKQWNLGLEVVDVFNREGVSFFQHVNMGTEVTLLAGISKIRGGFHQGYPTFGLGIDLKILSIDVAKFTRELGNAPGHNPDDRIFVQLSFGW